MLSLLALQDRLTWAESMTLATRLVGGVGGEVSAPGGGGGIVPPPPEMEVVTVMLEELLWLREVSMARADSECCPLLRYAVLRAKLWADETDEPQRMPS